MKIKDLPLIDRPREKLQKYGPAKLSDAELLAILFGHGSGGLSAIELAKKVLKKIGLENIADSDVKELREKGGLGEAKACSAVACFELGKRFLNKQAGGLIMSPRDVFEELKDERKSKKEHFIIFYLDSRSRLIQKETVSIGILDASLIHPREVFEPAVKVSARQIIMAHNHPSGDPSPSETDLETTDRLLRASKIMGIDILDHVIVCQNSFFSFADKKLI